MADSLILIGFMGSGKSAVGKELAGRMGREFRDADRVVEERSGRSVEEIFAREGEPEFRRLEEAAVRDLLAEGAESGGLVISLGGGAVTSADLRHRLASEPLVVLLDTDVELAYRRSQDGKRPLARNRRQFESLFQERQPLYESVAKIKIDTRGRSIRQVAKAVIGAIEERNKES